MNVHNKGGGKMQNNIFYKKTEKNRKHSQSCAKYQYNDEVSDYNIIRNNSNKTRWTKKHYRKLKNYYTYIPSVNLIFVKYSHGSYIKINDANEYAINKLIRKEQQKYCKNQIVSARKYSNRRKN